MYTISNILIMKYYRQKSFFILDQILSVKCVCVRETERVCVRERETDRQTDRQTDKERDRNTEIWACVCASACLPAAWERDYW